jgi:mannose-6-phosphate isomerase-like protein (cupin superfamily)
MCRFLVVAVVEPHTVAIAAVRATGVRARFGAMHVRCVVTGKVDGGLSTVVRDGEVAAKTAALIPETAFHQIWGSDGTVPLPSDGTEPEWKGYFPPQNGFRFTMWTLGPESATPPEGLDLGAAVAEFNEKLPGLADVMEPDAPGMHTTDTIDFNVVLSGEVWLELDAGQEVLLHAGDCVVQNGTRHAWHNRTEEPVHFATTIVGAVAPG